MFATVLAAGALFAAGTIFAANYEWTFDQGDLTNAFGRGRMVYADGVARAAIQGLNQRLTGESKRRDAYSAELKERLARWEQIVAQKSTEGQESRDQRKPHFLAE